MAILLDESSQELLDESGFYLLEDAVDITTGLSRHWKLDDNASSTTVVATVGSNGTLNGGNNTEDIDVGAGNGPGGALLNAGFSFDDGIPDVIAIGSQSATTTISHAFWVNKDDAGNDRIYHFGKTLIEVTPVSVVWFPNWASTSKTFLTTLTAGTWYHIVITQTGTTAILYVNGVQVGTDTVFSVSTTAENSNIGALLGNNQPFDGKACDFRTYNRVLAVDDIGGLFALGKPQNSLAPSITGTPVVGVTLEGDNGTWSDGTPAYQWIKCDDAAKTNPSNIGSATSADFTVTESELTKWVFRRTTQSNGIGSTVVDSNVVGPVRVASTTFSGVRRSIRRPIVRSINRGI